MSESYEHVPVSVEDNTAVVIGGTSGIGEAVALGFATEGADVIATSRSDERVAATASKLRDLGAETAEVTCDVAGRASVRSLRDAAFETFGDVDVLVNSAGTAARRELADLEDDDWNHVLDVNLAGVFRATQLFAERMDDGSVINVSSIAADQARRGLSPYCASKAGVNAFTRAASKELAPEIRVNAIAPGFVITPLTEGNYDEGTEAREQIDARTPMERVAEREEIVGAALYLASEASSFTTGEVLRVDGGFVDSAL